MKILLLLLVTIQKINHLNNRLTTQKDNKKRTSNQMQSKINKLYLIDSKPINFLKNNKSKLTNSKVKL